MQTWFAQLPQPSSWKTVREISSMLLAFVGVVGMMLGFMVQDLWHASAGVKWLLLGAAAAALVTSLAIGLADLRSGEARNDAVTHYLLGEDRALFCPDDFGATPAATWEMAKLQVGIERLEDDIDEAWELDLMEEVEAAQVKKRAASARYEELVDAGENARHRSPVSAA